MSEFPPPAEPGDAAGARQEGLTPQAIEGVLADFRLWLEQLKDEGRRMKDESGGTSLHPSSFVLHPSGEPLDLHMLLGQFVALRHEVNLQTKASRAQQEQNTEALRRLGEALEVMEEARAAPVAPAAPSADESVRPLLKTLVDLYDNLSLARREVQRVQEVLKPILDQFTAVEASGICEPSQATAPAGTEALSSNANASHSPTPPRRSFLARWFAAGGEEGKTLRAWQDEATTLRQQMAAQRQQLQVLNEQLAQKRQAAERVRGFVTSLVTGYTMSLQRVERALQQHGLEEIPTVGLPFDPETMEVLEVVHEPGRTTTEVIEEVRRGYRWREKLFRFSQVRVARPQPS
jgi:molecular chaperone GrpE